jgi:predicted transcriptional regulator
MTKKLYEIAADIIQVQVSTSPMSAEEIASSLVHVFNALQDIQKAEVEGMSADPVRWTEEMPEEEKKASEQKDPKRSVQDDRIICLECGAEMRQLTAKHLSSHGLNPRDYKKKWGFPLKQSLSAKALSKARSRAAKKRGLPQNLLKFQEDRKQKKFATRSKEAEAVLETVSEAQGEADQALKRAQSKKVEQGE